MVGVGKWMTDDRGMIRIGWGPYCGAKEPAQFYGCQCSDVKLETWILLLTLIV